jgi:hypothetical protein
MKMAVKQPNYSWAASLRSLLYRFSAGVYAYFELYFLKQVMRMMFW